MTELGSTFDKCKAQDNAYAKCGFSKGASDFQCSAAGEAEFKDGVCTSELNAVIACVSK